MGKITEALKKAAQERLNRIEKRDSQDEVRYEFVARKTVDSKIDPRIVTFYDQASPVSEQYRTLRTNIQAIRGQHPVKAITVTSSVHGEGKTITAINLAVLLARDLNKKKVLLIDADMRRARVSRYLGFTPEKGLADLLHDGASIDDTLLNIGIDNLTVLPAGKSSHNPAELISSTKMNSLISAFKERYDYVIFDTPPVIPVTDAGVLGAQTDGVLIVIQANRTQQGIIKHGESLLRQAQARILGYVLTNIQYHIPEYIYRYL